MSNDSIDKSPNDDLIFSYRSFKVFLTLNIFIYYFFYKEQPISIYFSKDDKSLVHYSSSKYISNMEILCIKTKRKKKLQGKKI